MAIVLDGVGTVNGVTLPTTGFGKVLQVVRATDATDRTTTSTSFVDVTGMAVTITPQKVDSTVIVIASFVSEVADTASSSCEIVYQITNSSNIALSGAEYAEQRISATGSTTVFLHNYVSIFAYVAPATLSAVTYKMRFKQGSATSATVANGSNTGQMYAIEVSA